MYRDTGWGGGVGGGHLIVLTLISMKCFETMIFHEYSSLVNKDLGETSNGLGTVEI